MPRPSKGARLYLRAGEVEAGRVRKRAVWIIRDGSHRESTGCLRENRAGAEQSLRDYLAAKYEPGRQRDRDPSEILILDVLNIYLTDKAKNHARPKETT
jgi:hypothetical protein